MIPLEGKPLQGVSKGSNEVLISRIVEDLPKPLVRLVSHMCDEGHFIETHEHGTVEATAWSAHT